MTVLELITQLGILVENKDIDKNESIDINHGNGLYDSIDRIGVQSWTDRDGFLHRTATIFTKPYDQKESIL